MTTNTQPNPPAFAAASLCREEFEWGPWQVDKNDPARVIGDIVVFRTGKITITKDYLPGTVGMTIYGIQHYKLRHHRGNVLLAYNGFFDRSKTFEEFKAPSTVTMLGIRFSLTKF